MTALLPNFLLVELTPGRKLVSGRLTPSPNTLSTMTLGVVSGRAIVSEVDN